ncbi:hypothetical protein Tco_0342858, partial [Tanacetum coccineum]
DDVHTNSKDPLASAMIVFALHPIIVFALHPIPETKHSFKETGGKGHYARNCLKPRVRDSKYFMEQMLLAKQDEAGVILTDE